MHLRFRKKHKEDSIRVAEEARGVWVTGYSLGGGHALEKGSERGHCKEASIQMLRNNGQGLVLAKVTFQ